MNDDLDKKFVDQYKKELNRMLSMRPLLATPRRRLNWWKRLCRRIEMVFVYGR
jgi:hypothetical protein